MTSLFKRGQHGGVRKLSEFLQTYGFFRHPQKFRIMVCLTAKYQDLTRLLAIVSEIKQNNFLKNLKNLLNSHSNEKTQISAKIVQKLVVVDIFYKKSLIIYSPVLKEKHRFSFGTFQAGEIGLHWTGYIGVKVPNERPVSLFKHQISYLF